jgi:hypothetical protein
MPFPHQLLAVDVTTLRVEMRWGGILAILCGVLGALVGGLIPRRSVAVLAGGLLGSVVALICARMYAATYGFGSHIDVFLAPFLPIGFLCGVAGAFRGCRSAAGITRQDRGMMAGGLVLALGVATWFYVYPSQLVEAERQQAERDQRVNEERAKKMAAEAAESVMGKKGPRHQGDK